MMSPFMAKKGQSGCMSGLIHMFDFICGPKCLSDGIHGISRHSVRSDIKGSQDPSGVKAVYAGRASIRMLMEEEMSSDTQALKQTQRNIFGSFSDDMNSVNLPEGHEVDLDLAASLMEIYRSHSEGHISDSIDQESNADSGAPPYQIPSIIQKALEDVAEAVILHQSGNAKCMTSSSAAARSKDFVDALQLLSSNKELFLMLLQDPSSRLLQCLQNLYMSLGSSKLEQNTEYDELVMRKPSKLNDSSPGLSRIVILKPGPARSQSNLISHSFSLRELRRRLKLATMSSNFQKDDSTKKFHVQSLSISSGSTDYSDCERSKQPSIVDKITSPEDSGNAMGNDATQEICSFSYEKAKKHLIERLHNQDEDSSQIVHKSESFGRLISFPEYDTSSPNHCPPEENISLSLKTTDSLKLQMIEQDDNSANSNLSRQCQGTLSPNVSASEDKLLDELATDHGNHPPEEDATQELTDEDVKNMQGAVDNLPLCTEVESSSENLEQMNSDQLASEKPHFDLVEEQDDLIQEAKPSILTIACSLENSDEKVEKQSPQSVMDSSLGDCPRPNHKTRKQGEFSMPSSRILFKELDTPSESPTSQNRPQIALLYDQHERVLFIKSVLEASELLAGECSEIWYMNVFMLDPSVLAEVGASYCLTDHVVLLFDCVEEVLLDIRRNFFGFDPLVAYLQHKVRPAPVGTKLVEEVAMCINSLVSTEEIPRTLDEVVMKDLEIGPWMDLRRHTENIVVEVWDGVLDDLLEEMIFDLWL